MRMLRWQYGVRKKEETRTERVRGFVNVTNITEKMCRHFKRMRDGHMLRRMLDAPVPGKRQRGRRKTRWKDSCKRYMESTGLKVGGVFDRTKRNGFQTIPATPHNGEITRTRII